MDPTIRRIIQSVLDLSELVLNISNRIKKLERVQEEQRIALAAYLLHQKQTPAQEEE